METNRNSNYLLAVQLFGSVSISLLINQLMVGKKYNAKYISKFVYYENCKPVKNMASNEKEIRYNWRTRSKRVKGGRQLDIP